MDIKVFTCVGGTRFDKRELAIAQIIVGTEGKVLTLSRKHYIVDLSRVQIFVLDEADGLLAKDPTQIDEVQEIAGRLSRGVQTVFFSAAIPEEVDIMRSQIMRNPVDIVVEKDKRILQGVQQFYINVDDEEFKSKSLVKLFNRIGKQIQAVIFCDGHEIVEFLKTELWRNDYSVLAIHSKSDQYERSIGLKDFSEGLIRFLITTNLIGRGITVHRIPLVINYDMPATCVDYAHRIGHMGRLGERTGVVISFVASEDDMKSIKELESFYETKIEEIPANIDTYF